MCLCTSGFHCTQNLRTMCNHGFSWLSPSSSTRRTPFSFKDICNFIETTKSTKNEITSVFFKIFGVKREYTERYVNEWLNLTRWRLRSVYASIYLRCSYSCKKFYNFSEKIFSPKSLYFTHIYNKYVMMMIHTRKSIIKFVYLKLITFF